MKNENTRYAVWLGNALHIAGLENMAEAVKYVEDNLPDKKPTDVTVSRSTHMAYQANDEMTMDEYLAWLMETNT